jgi:membrane protease YdiL (CAAX protease family)
LLSHIPTPDLPLDVALILILLNLSPTSLSRFLQVSQPALEQRTPFRWYFIVLAGITAATYYELHTPPRVLGSGSLVWVLVAGVGLGALAVAIEAVTLRSVRGWRPVVASSGVALTHPWPGSAYADAPTAGSRARSDATERRRISLAALMVGAVLEECIYRQALLVLLVAVTLDPLIAATIATLAFGLVHFQFGLGAVVSKLMIGALFTGIVLSGGALATVIVAHAVFNAAAYFAPTRAVANTAVVF